MRERPKLAAPNSAGHWVSGRIGGRTRKKGACRRKTVNCALGITTKVFVSGPPEEKHQASRTGLEAAEEFVELIGCVEVGFEFARTEALAKIVKPAGKKIQCGGEDLAIG